MSLPNYRNLTDPNYGRPAKKQHEPLQQLTRPHIDSFNYVLKGGLSDAVKNIRPVEFPLANGDIASLHYVDASISKPTVPQGSVHVKTLKVYPAECRERGVSYKGPLHVTVVWRINGELMGTVERNLGSTPIMVKSAVCNLDGLSPKELIAHGEEAEEMGGYFLSNGLEKIMRMLIMPRRNYPTAISRPSWKKRGRLYTEYGVSMRCVQNDQTASNLVLHYLTNGTATLSFTYMKEQFFVPVVMMLKALVDVPDQFIYSELIKGREENSFYCGCVAHMLRQAQTEGLVSRHSVLKFIGERFRIKLNSPDWYTDKQVAEFLLEKCVCIHLKDNLEKFNILVYMTRKLFAFAKGECAAESADNPMNQEVLLAGHLYLMVLKENLEGWLRNVVSNIKKKMEAKQTGGFMLDAMMISDCCKHTIDVCKSMDYLLSTGNLVSRSGLGLMQASGLTVIADKLNFYRYISHFRCVHRGAFFAEMRTTAVRKLLPEAWGFLCPVHTPDGSPCGLLNHMAARCEVVNTLQSTATIPKLLCSFGMTEYNSPSLCNYSECYIVLLDGVMIGWIHKDIIHNVTLKLRHMKVKGINGVSQNLEICFVPMTKYASQSPGLFLFSNTARMMRPVRNLAMKTTEMIGTFEQVYLNICLVPEEAHEGITTHQELSESAMLSAIASLTPYSDYNQSPRNMYQCQMGKQTMGTPCHALMHRADNKLYRIQTPQAPVCRPSAHDYYGIDNYPLGTNAVVCVISYTGYDMEDAMILNKGSFERGFAHASIYKCESVNLRDISRETSRLTLMFGVKPGDTEILKKLDSDGLPPIGTFLQQGDPFYSFINIQTGEVKVEKYKSQEPAFVDQIKLCGDNKGNDVLQKVNIILRIQRNPIIGDKFASRHGQKGVCSQKWPVEDMPFSETGMQPDIIFNPHGFPSRMTIGMMIESMAGKSGASHGLCHDATPFTYSEDRPPIDYFGRMLTAAGYNYYGNERLYSGIDGREFEVDIFVGIVYYQRLRHMVSDKFQVRTTGPIDILTHQPLKGRKRGGGVRFGEMERDGLLSHGTAFLLQDRLFNCSDKSMTQICTKCGNILTPSISRAASEMAAASKEEERTWSCLVCKTKDSIEVVNIPYVFRYLVAELAAMNIKVTLDATEIK